MPYNLNNNNVLLRYFCQENDALLTQKGFKHVLADDLKENPDYSILCDFNEKIEGNCLNHRVLPIFASKELYFTIKKWKPSIIYHPDKPYFSYLVYNKSRFCTAALYFPNSNALFTANLYESAEGLYLLKRIIEHLPDREVRVISEEQYLTENGACRQDIGDSALHKNRGKNSDKVWSKIVDNQARKDKDIIEKREYLRTEYKHLCDIGELRPPTRIEILFQNANGSEELESTIAARILLEKRGIDWRGQNRDKGEIGYE